MDVGGPIINTESFMPAEMAKRVEAAGVKKTAMPFLQTATLGVLGGRIHLLWRHALHPGDDRQ